MLGSMRLPFLFQKFDAEAERTSLKILKGMGRFEGREDISERTITRVILDEGLRSRLNSERTEDEYEEIALIRDALVTELQALADAKEKTSKDLASSLEGAKTALAAQEAETKAKDEEVERLKRLVFTEKSRAVQAAQKLEAMDTEVNNLKKEMEFEGELREQRLVKATYTFFLFIVLVSSGIASAFVKYFALDLVNIGGLGVTRALVAALVFLFGHLILELWARRWPRLAQLWPFKLVKQFRKWLWGVAVLGLLIGVCGSLFANKIQKNMDMDIQSQQGSLPTSVVEGD